MPPRLLGLILLACSGGSTLVHRSVYEAARSGPAQPAEFALALLSFVLANTGILLLIHGARLFARAVSSADSVDHRPALTFRSRIEAPITPRGRAFDTRHGASMMQARHAIAALRQTRSTISYRPLETERPTFDWTTSPRR